MRFLYYTNIPTPYKSQQLESWAQALEEGSTIEVVYLGPVELENLWATEELKAQGVSERWLRGTSPLSRILSLWSERKLFSGCTIIIGGYHQIFHWVILGLARLYALRCVLVFDGINPRKIQQRAVVRRSLKRCFSAFCDAGLGNGQVSKMYLTHSLGFDPADLFEQGRISLPEGSDHASPQSDQEIQNWRAIIGVPEGHRVICFCGRLVERKRIQDLIEALSHPDLAKNVCLIVIGDGPLRMSLEQFATTRGVQAIFTGAIKSRDELFKALGRVDLLVLPSADEPWGIVVNEALAVGTMVVASSECGCSMEFDAIEGAGRVFASRDILALRQAVNDSLGNPVDRKRVIELSQRINNRERTSDAFGKFARAMNSVRVLVYQPEVPRYRVPFFAGIRALGVELRIVSDQSEEIPELDGSLVRGRVRSLGSQSVIWQYGASQLLRRRWDAVVLWGNPRVLSNVILLLIAFLGSTPSFWWGHLFTAGSPKWRRRWKLHALRFLTDRILVYTLAERSQLISEGMAPDRVHGLNNTIDTAVVNFQRMAWRSRDLASHLSERWGLVPGYHLFTGRLTEKCGLSLALTALNRGSTSSRLVVVGDGICQDALRTQVQSSGLQDRVRFLGEIYDEAILAPLFLGARSFVYPGSVGLSLLHAMAYGVPPVVHDQATSQMPEYAALVAGANGMVFRKGDADSLAEALRRLDEEPALRDRLSAAARETVEGEWTMSMMAERFVSAIRSAKRRRS